MLLISSNIKEKIINSLKDIINIEDINWINLDLEIKLKLIHNLCNLLKKNFNNINIDNSSINIPLKNLRPKKFIQYCGINKQMNLEIYNKYLKNIININREFRKKYNSNNKFYCFANLSKNNYDDILNNYNYNFYNFLFKNMNFINSKILYDNLLGNNKNKVINNNSNNKLNNINIKQITFKEKFLNIEFKNNITFYLELYLTSEKITNNIPAKYKIYLINIL